MKRLLTLTAITALSTTCLVAPATSAFAAEAPASTTASVTQDRTLQQRVEAALATAPVDEALKARVRAAVAGLPADFDAQARSVAERHGVDTEWTEIIQSVINPADHQCSSTEIKSWIADQTKDISWWSMFLLSMVAGDSLPTYDALVFGHESPDNTFGIDGSYTQRLGHSMRTLRSFWDIPTDIELIPMHGAEVYADLDRMARVYEVVFGQDPDQAMELALTVQEIVAADPALQGGANPVFTFNAFAFDPQGDPDLIALGITKRIVMGDGILQGMDAIGLQDMAARSILAHEYAHQVQYAKDLFDSPLTGPEATRRTELMADGFATFYLTHKRGEAINEFKVLDSEESFYEVGDCSFRSNGHHGTPNQRFRAATWGADSATSAHKQGHILPSLTMAERFDAVLPELVAPDAR